MNKKQKIIYDLIHNYITITKDVEIIINDESFQRLKHINQTTSYHLFPSTNHTRFEHSLGVMKLAIDFFNKLRDPFKYSYTQNGYDKLKINMKNKENYNHLIFAALLHDVGHSPFSHLCEDFYSKREIKERINEKIVELKLTELNYENLIKGSEHEWMSCLVIINNLYDKLKNIFSNNNTKIDFEYIVRIITGNKYEDSNLHDFWDRDLIISILNSETVDVDKLDYLMRDNFMAGMIGPNIDIERLLLSLIITEDRKLGFSKTGVSAIQKIIECRDNIYLWLCNHHTVVYTDFLMHECIFHMGKLYKYNKANCELPEYINKNKINSCEKVNELMKYYSLFNEKDGTLKINRNLTAKQKKMCLEILKEINYLPYVEAFNMDDYFSINAILEKRITDNEVNALINRIKYFANKNILSIHTERMINQLINRNFLKPVWKTLYQYNQFIEKHIHKNKQKSAIDYILASDKNRKKIVTIICKNADCRIGEIFLFVKKNKFYFMPQLSNIFIYSHDSVENKEIHHSIDELLPQKDYQSMYNEITFYLYCKEEKINTVIREFVNIMNNHKKIDFHFNEINKI